MLDAGGLSSATMQAIAREINFSETTFVLEPEVPDATARVRIFTPMQELPFAGHPTIGTAWVLWQQTGQRELVLQEEVGLIRVQVEGDTLWMTQPPVTFGAVVSDRAAVAEAIGLAEPDLVPGVPIQVASTGLPFLFVPIRTAQRVDAARPNEALLRQGEPVSYFVFAVVAPDRLYSRMFGAHSVGIVEDPATGSASGPLGAYAVKYGLLPAAPAVSFVSEQGTAMGRRGLISVRLTYGGQPDVPERVEVGGSVVPVLTGQLSASGWQNPAGSA